MSGFEPAHGFFSVAEKRKNEFIAVIIETDNEPNYAVIFDFQLMIKLLCRVEVKSSILWKKLWKAINGSDYSLEFEKRFTDKILELEVRTFNKRALQYYLSAGFSKLHTYTKKRLLAWIRFY